jgi:hypothetical protein
MGDVRLELYTEGQWIGYAILPDLNVQPGANQIQSFTFFSPGADDPVGRRMVSNYLMGMATQIRMIGTSDRSTPIAVMSGSLSHLNLTAPMDGVKEPLVRRSYLKVSPKTLFNDRATARFEVVNPFKVPFTILAMQAQIKDDVMREIGLLDVNLNSYNNSNSNNNNGTVAAGGEKVPENERPFTVGPDMIAKTPYYPLDLLVDWDTVDLAKGGVFSTFDVSAECLIECTVGEYRLSVEYNQTRVPTELKFI